MELKIFEWYWEWIDLLSDLNNSVVNQAVTGHLPPATNWKDMKNLIKEEKIFKWDILNDVKLMIFIYLLFSGKITKESTWQ